MAKKPKERKYYSTRIDNVLRQRTNALWGYVRQNKHSLNSADTCKEIRAVLDVAVLETQCHIDELLAQVKVAQGESKQLRKQLAEMRKVKVALASKLAAAKAAAAAKEAEEAAAAKAAEEAAAAEAGESAPPKKQRKRAPRKKVAVS